MRFICLNQLPETSQARTQPLRTGLEVHRPLYIVSHIHDDIDERLELMAQEHYIRKPRNGCGEDAEQYGDILEGISTWRTGHRILTAAPCHPGPDLALAGNYTFDKEVIDLRGKAAIAGEGISNYVRLGSAER